MCLECMFPLAFLCVLPSPHSLCKSRKSQSRPIPPFNLRRTWYCIIRSLGQRGPHRREQIQYM